jgi:phosphoribosylanthranilate isomerase
MTRVKVRGLMSEADVEMVASAGTESLGFVTEYSVPVPWNIPRKRSAELVASAPPFVTTTAVVGGWPFKGESLRCRISKVGEGEESS